MVEIKTMTRKQVKDLRKAGLDLVLLGEADKTKTIEALEWVFDHVYPELADDDELSYREMIRIATKTFEKTYGTDAELKN